MHPGNRSLKLSHPWAELRWTFGPQGSWIHRKVAATLRIGRTVLKGIIVDFVSASAYKLRVMTASIPHTLTLDDETYAAVDRLAKLWGQPEEEVVKRAVEAAEPLLSSPSEIQRKLDALRDVQQSVASRGVDFDEWRRVVYESRR